LHDQGQYDGQKPGGDSGRTVAGIEHMVRAGQEEHRHPAAEGMTSPRVVRLVVLLLGVLSASTASGEPIAHREVLPNGIVLLVAERPAVPIVAVRVLSRAGAAFDPSDRAG